ncbi:MAG TPA: dienelactone hydrolase, partial [Planctomycetia bacterium]|nr:dienelactone hydrolase [Planctomycetia bacterium]
EEDAEKSPRPAVLFSHGLGGSRNNSGHFGRHWSARGYVVVIVQHPGSDESVWKSAKLGEKFGALKQAASGRNFALRNADIPAVLDQLTAWNGEKSHALAGRLDLARLGMSGHSFGAVTTQAVSGQSFPLGKSFTDPRIKAAIAMSPSPPSVGDPARAFGSVKIPWLLMTGTEDDSPIGNQTPADRLKVYPALPSGSKYEVVFDGAKHAVFGERGARNPNHAKAILALTTAFWDAHLKGDVDARNWLDGPGPQSVLEPKDSWKTK